MTENILLKGKVIEILENGDKKIAKVACSTCFVKVAINEFPDVRLNDKVSIDARLTVDKISHDLSENSEQKLDLN